VGIDPSHRACTKRVCGVDGKWYKNTSEANQKGVKIDPSGKKCKGSPPPPGGGGGDFQPPTEGGAGWPDFYSYMQGLPNEIDALYSAINEQNLKDIAFMQGFY